MGSSAYANRVGNDVMAARRNRTVRNNDENNDLNTIFLLESNIDLG